MHLIHVGLYRTAFLQTPQSKANLQDSVVNLYSNMEMIVVYRIRGP